MRKILSILLLLSLTINYITLGQGHDVTREESCQLVLTILYGSIRFDQIGNAFEDCDNEDVRLARGMNVISGYDNNTFLPKNKITKQEFLIMVKRALDMKVPNILYDNKNIKLYNDDSSISPFARNYIRQLSSIGIHIYGNLNPTAPISSNEAFYYVEMAKNAIKISYKSTPGVFGSKTPKVLMYHSVSNVPSDAKNCYLFISPEKFEEQIKYLHDEGYTFLFPEELSYASKCQKSVIITFDDGYKDNYTQAMPILEKYNAKATLYMVSNYVDLPNYCSKSQLLEMSNRGSFRIYSHSVSHRNLCNLSYDDLKNEFINSNNIIYNITKRDVTSISYPFGQFNNQVTDLAKRYYKTAFGVGNNYNQEILRIHRIVVDGRNSLDKFIKLVK